MAIPEKKIIAPAIRLLYFSIGLRFILLSPILNASTINNIVDMVTAENKRDTITAPEILFSAAGYITIGIRGSQGPNTKIRNSIHGVVFTALLSWIWVCSR
jgi:hypothetical protein